MSKVNLTNLSSLQNEQSAITIINNNNDAIEAAVEKTLSRDGTMPNQMTSDLDMNGQNLLNLPEPVSILSPVRIIDLVDPQIAIEIPGTGTSGHTVGWLDGDNTTSGNNIHTGTETFVNSVILGDSASVGGVPFNYVNMDFTGDLKHRYGTGTLAGYVRCNGLTIGSASSGATERANADTQTLFTYLWGADSNLAVSGGRGVSAAADWSANKNIALPDFRGRTLSGLDDMGSSAASRLTSTYLGTSATVLGASGGSQSHTLTSAQIPAHTHPNTLTDPGHTHGLNGSPSVVGTNSTGGQGGGTYTAVQGAFNLSINSSTTGLSITNASNTGGGGAHNNIQPTALVTIYIKL